MESCSGHRLLALYARIDARIKIIWSRLGDTPGRRHFAVAEKAWLAYAENECTSRSRAWIDPAHPHQYVGGTAAGVEYALCEEELSATHLRDLTETAAALGQH